MTHARNMLTLHDRVFVLGEARACWLSASNGHLPDAEPMIALAVALGVSEGSAATARRVEPELARMVTPLARLVALGCAIWISRQDQPPNDAHLAYVAEMGPRLGIDERTATLVRFVVDRHSGAVGALIESLAHATVSLS